MWRRLADWCLPAGSVMPPRLTVGDYPRHVLVFPQHLGDAEYEALKARWLAAHGQGRNRPTHLL